MSYIAFPEFGIRFMINPVAFKLWGIEIYFYGMIIALAFCFATVLALNHCSKYDIKQDDIIDFLLVVIPIAIVGARLYYVCFSWDKYKDNLSEIFRVWHGGIAIYGAIFASVITAYLFATARRINKYKFFDFLSPYLVLGQAIGRWGNFVNQEAYGVETNLPWRMEILDPTNLQIISVHPTFLYEFLWNLGVFAFLMWFRKRKKLHGEVFMLYMALYALGRFWIEGLRVDSLYLGPLRISQVVAAVLGITMSLTFYLRRRASRKLS